MLSMYTRGVIIALWSLSSALSSLAKYTWPNYVMDELEHLLVDTGGFNNGGVRDAITPCSNYVSGSQTLGRGTVAQWVRIAFHDMSTADLSAGTGGLDASIGFETLRPENSGPAMNDTLRFFAPYVNAYVSMSDLIALGVAMAVDSCSYPTSFIPLRGGRIDASEAGPYGVPEPTTNISATLQRFAGTGFNQSDAIALTACGHSLGSVHYSTFPDIVTNSSVSANNTDGGVIFDTTPTVFDVRVIQEYTNWTGYYGGPLVTSYNVAARSDLRLYISDQNATMQSLLSSQSYFSSRCVDVVTRMINTVPAAVTLTDVIAPIPVKPVSVSVSVDTSGKLYFSGYIRLLSTSHTENAKVTVSWASRTGLHADFASIEAKSVHNGTSLFGTTYYHSFSISIDAELGISRFDIAVKDDLKITRYANGGDGYPVQGNVVWLPAESTVSATFVSISAAVLTSLDPRSISAVFYIPMPQSGTLSPMITNSTIALEKSSVRGLYTVYTGSATLSLTNVNQSSVDIIAITSNGAVVKNEFNKLNTGLSY